MGRCFNVTGSCSPKLHYMVDIQGRLAEIKKMVDAGAYFTVNRARQYGKTTMLTALTDYLRDEYVVIYLDFQLIGNAKFASEHSFSKAFANYIYRSVRKNSFAAEHLDISILKEAVEQAGNDESFALDDLFPLLSDFCETAGKPVVMIVDEVDSASNNQVFLDFLAQLRGYYLARVNQNVAAFQSVILAGVYDVKNIRLKIRPDEAHKVNSPWNIAADFLVNMSFFEDEIAGMLGEYEDDHHTGMDVEMIASLIYDYTSGYPFLVSKNGSCCVICKYLNRSKAINMLA